MFYNQSIEIQQLKDNCTQLGNRIKVLEDSNKQLVDSNRVLNNTVNNQSVIISWIIKLELQLNEIKQLQADKDKLNAEIKF